MHLLVCSPSYQYSWQAFNLLLPFGMFCFMQNNLIYLYVTDNQRSYILYKPPLSCLSSLIILHHNHQDLTEESRTNEQERHTEPDGYLKVDQTQRFKQIKVQHVLMVVLIFTLWLQQQIQKKVYILKVYAYGYSTTYFF